MCAAGASTETRVVVLGNFDGVHRGHQEVAAYAAARAADVGTSRPPRLITFHPHPAAVLGRGVPPVLTSRRRKRELVERLRPAVELFEQPFDLAFAAQSPREFAELLVREHGARCVVVGADFRFGKGRAGDFSTLATLGGELGFEASAHALVGDAGGPISSTRIRAAITSGDLGGAEALLGRPHMVEGVVVRGKRLGRTIGFPTCNLGGIEELVPPDGVYATLVDHVGADGEAQAIARGATSIGDNPTVDGARVRTVETFLWDVVEPRWSEELYGERLRVHLVARLRGMERFDGLPALVEQMGRDVDEARELLRARAPSGRAWA